MESIMQYLPVWSAYLGFSCFGLWCWNKLFFMLKQGSAARQILQVLGFALLFTPAPSQVESTHFAPALFVLLFDLLEGKNPLASAALIWLLTSSCILLVLVILLQLLKGSRKEA